MVLVGPNERGSMFSVGQSSSFFANCSYLRGINFFRKGKGGEERGRVGEGERGERGRWGEGERGRGGKIFTLDLLA
jgi:hypothetical protein